METKKWHELAATRISERLYEMFSSRKYRSEEFIPDADSAIAVDQYKMAQKLMKQSFVRRATKIIADAELIGTALARTPEENQKLLDLITEALNEKG